MQRHPIPILLFVTFDCSQALSLGPSLPVAQERTEDRQGTAMAPWVIKAIIVGFVIFAVAFLLFYFYAECMAMLPDRPSLPVFLAPVVSNDGRQAEAVGPFSNARRIWTFFSQFPATSFRFGVPPRPTYEEIGLQEIDRPPRAFVRFKIRAPVAGPVPGPG